MFAHLTRQGAHPRTAALKAGTRLRRLAAALAAVTIGLLASAATIPAAFASDVPQPGSGYRARPLRAGPGDHLPRGRHRHAGLADHPDRRRRRTGRGRRDHRAGPGAGRPTGRPVASRLTRPARLVHHTSREPSSQLIDRRGLADQAAARPAHTPSARRPGTRPEPHDGSSRQPKPHV